MPAADMEYSPPTAAATVWEAAANARAWAGSMHAHAACTERRMAWAAKAKADDAMKRMAGAYAHATNTQGKIGADTMRLAADTMRQAASAMETAAEAFGRSSKLAGAAAKDLKRAARAYGRAGDEKNAGMMREWAARSRKDALGSDKRAARTGAEAGLLTRSAGRLAAVVALWSAGEYALGGDRDAMALSLSNLWEDAKEERMESAATAMRAEEAERLAAAAKRLTATAAEQSAAAAGAACKRPEPDVQEAAAAWRKAMAAANRAKAATSKAREEGR